MSTPGSAATPSTCSATATPTSPTTTTRSRATSTTCSATSTRCGIDRAHLAGESLGGWVAAWLTSDHPERVITLQLVAAGGTKANPEIMERIRTSTLRAVELDDTSSHPTAARAADAPHRGQRHRRARRRPPPHLPHPDVPTEHPPSALPAEHGDPPAQPAAAGPTGPVGRHADADHLGQREPLRRRPRSARHARAHPRIAARAVRRVRHWPQYEHAELYNPMSIAFLRERH